MAPMEKACSKCGIVKPLDEFHKKKGRSDGRRSECKSCSKAYRVKNRDRISEMNRRHYRRPEVRARKIASAKRSAENRREEVREYQRIYQAKRRAAWDKSFDWDVALGIYGHKCAICGQEGVGLTVGHIIPVSRGGAGAQWNIRPECLPCNKSKFTRLDCEMEVPPQCRTDLA